LSLLFTATGLIGGMSTVFTTVWSFLSRAPYFNSPRFLASGTWRLIYAGGLLAGAVLWMLTLGAPQHTTVPLWQLAVGGFIAGFGARLANGCTAGHGICGIASLQAPSIAAVAIFLATAMATAHLVRAFA
jgi:uncharacterized membrane protein YedE/YeeE